MNFDVGIVWASKANNQTIADDALINTNMFSGLVINEEYSNNSDDIQLDLKIKLL